MNFQIMKRHGGNLNACYEVKESHLEKSKYCMIPTRLHSGKGKTMETIKKIRNCRGWWPECRMSTEAELGGHFGQ